MKQFQHFGLTSVMVICSITLIIPYKYLLFVNLSFFLWYSFVLFIKPTSIQILHLEDICLIWERQPEIKIYMMKRLFDKNSELKFKWSLSKAKINEENEINELI